MNDFQEQAKNWLRNVVKQNPDKIKAGMEKAGDLIDKQTGGKYAEKVDAVQEKVGKYVDSQGGAAGAAAAGSEASGGPGAQADATADKSPAGEAGPEGDGAPEAVTQPGGTTDTSQTDAPAKVVGGTPPDVNEQDARSAGSDQTGAETGSTPTTPKPGNS